MDSINTRIGQSVAREAATTINEKTFTNANLIGFQTGASAFSGGENAAVFQQVRFVDKAVADLPSKALEEKKLKENLANADKEKREEKVNISEAIGDISEFLRARGTELAFSIDNGTSRQVVTVMDKQTGDVIRQIPSEEVLDFAARIQELAANPDNSSGVLVDGRA
ncbi:flagellar protein FlaG [Glaciecola sp. 1036]|uniref:flagellar protein FlaG n=1 Tax=Alteromonadaceae TaxID=72275 RepID=UPI003D0330E6